MIALLAWSSAFAGGFEVAQQGAVAGGTGHAGTARSGDAALAWLNPAALADGGGLRVAVGAALASATIDARSTADDPWATSTDGALGTPPHLYASYAGGPLVAGVAVNTAFAGGVRWPDDGPLRFESVESSPAFVRVAPFVGGAVGALRVAVGAHVDAGSLYVEKATDHVTDEGLARILLRGRGVGADASVHVQATEALAVGLTYKGRTRLPLAGEADFDVPDPFAARLADGDVTAAWTLPDRLALGLGLDLDRWRAVVDASLTTWSVNDALVLDFADEGTEDVVQVNDWRDSVALRGGGELDADVVTVRAGAYVDGLLGAPGPTSTLGPSSPDGTRVGATLGAGVALGEHVQVDAFAEHMRILERASTSLDAPEAAYRGRATVGGLTASLAF